MIPGQEDFIAGRQLVEQFRQHPLEIFYRHCRLHGFLIFIGLLLPDTSHPVGIKLGINTHDGNPFVERLGH